MKLPLQAKAEENTLDWMSRSHLRYAAECNNGEIVISLCQAGADPYLGLGPLKVFDLDVNPDMKAFIMEYIGQ